MVKDSYYVFMYILGLVLVFVGIIAVEIYAIYQCGWAKAFIYGKNLPWALYLGYCG